MNRRSALFIIMCLAAFWSRQADAQNWHVDVVMSRLKELKYTLPKGEFVLLADQPVGIMQRAVVYDLSAKQLVYLPGDHSEWKITRQDLSPAKIALLRELMSLQSIRGLKTDSGKVGLDGAAFVAILKVGTLDKTLGHWQSDEAAIELLDALLRHDTEAIERRLQFEQR